MNVDALYLKVLKYLNYRPRSEKEIRDYLLEKTRKIPDFNTSLIDVLIDKLKSQRFLNDSDFAKWWVRSRINFKPKGKSFIVRELKQKGISQEIIEESFNQPDENLPTDLENAQEILEKKKKKYEGMDKYERLNKAGSMLARRGYNLDTIKSAIDSVFGK